MKNGVEDMNGLCTSTKTNSFSHSFYNFRLTIQQKIIIYMGTNNCCTKRLSLVKRCICTCCRLYLPIMYLNDFIDWKRARKTFSKNNYKKYPQYRVQQSFVRVYSRGGGCYSLTKCTLKLIRTTCGGDQIIINCEP